MTVDSMTWLEIALRLVGIVLCMGWGILGAYAVSTGAPKKRR